MQAQKLAFTFLISISELLGVKPIPVFFSDQKPHWKIVSDWSIQKNISQIELSSEDALTECEKHPEGIIRFPSIIQGAHTFYLNEAYLDQFGDPEFLHNRSFYGKPALLCSALNNTKKQMSPPYVLRWKAYSYARYFARLSSLGTLSEFHSPDNLFTENMNAFIAICLEFMAFLSLFILRKKIQKRFVFSFAFSNFFLGGYFICSTGFLFGISFPMLTQHKIADLFLWIGFLFLFDCFVLQKVISQKLFSVYFFYLIPCLLLIFFGDSGDTVQLGTTMVFPFVLAILVFAALAFLKNAFQYQKKLAPFLQSVSLIFFVLICIHDVFNVIGLLSNPMLLSLGVIAALFFMMIGINEQITETYQERDYLRENLQYEVQVKTAQLASSLDQLKTTQAELLQSSQLASIGTLAAGIAHEINNAINYVNGALPALEKIAESISDIKNKEKFQKLTKIMKQGIDLTLNIINSLKKTSGVNQSQMQDVNIAEMMQSVLTILASRYKNTAKMILQIEPQQMIYGSMVGLSQIFMNLIGNAFDSIESKGIEGTIIIRSFEDQNHICISVEDDGIGFSEEIKKKMLDPFFTTKPVGKGTGLGLYVVNSEIKKHQGKIEIFSEPNKGARFCLFFPKKPLSQPEAA
jgi:signal transduction histidine kinase